MAMRPSDGLFDLSGEDIPKAAARRSRAPGPRQGRSRTGGHALPRLCVSVGRGQPAEVLRALAPLDFAEVRIDLIDFGFGRALAPAPAWQGAIEPLFAAPRPCIATCRPGRFDAPVRRALLSLAVGSGARLVDLELDAPDDLLVPLRSALHGRGGQLLLSHHDVAHAPSGRELHALVSRALARGADLVKIACPVNQAEETKRLLALLDRDAWRGRVVLAGLGPLGGLFRCLALLKGAPFTYAAPDVGPKVLDDQPRAQALRQAFLRLRQPVDFCLGKSIKNQLSLPGRSMALR